MDRDLSDTRLVEKVLEAGLYGAYMPKPTYTATVLIGMPMGDYTIGGAFTTASSGTSVIDLVVRHEESITKMLGLGIQSKLVSVAGSSTTLFSGTSVYATIGF